MYVLVHKRLKLNRNRNTKAKTNQLEFLLVYFCRNTLVIKKQNKNSDIMSISNILNIPVLYKALEIFLRGKSTFY